LLQHSTSQQGLVLNLSQVHHADLALQPVSALLHQVRVILGDAVGEPDLLAPGPELEVEVVEER
jgi:hypothetical protein